MPSATSRTLTILSAANFAAATAGMMIAGVLQLIATDFGIDVATAGHLITAYALGFAIGAPLLGALTGRFCRKQIVFVGLLIVGVGSLASAFAPSATLLTISRVLVAAGACLVIPSVSAIAVHIASPQERPRALSRVIIGMTMAWVLGVPIGTWLGAHLGWHTALAVSAAGAFLMAAVVKFGLPGDIVVPPIPLRAWGGLLTNWRVHVVGWLGLLHLGATFTLYAYIAPFLSDVVGVDGANLSLMLAWYGVAGLTGNIVFSIVGHRFDRDRMLAASLLVSVCAVATMYWTSHHWIIAVLAGGIWSAMGNLFAPLQQSRMVALAPSAGAALLALHVSAIFVGQAIGSWVGGVITTHYGLDVLPIAAALFGSATIIFSSSHEGGRCFATPRLIGARG